MTTAEKKRPTHGEQILQILADGRWHTSRQIHSRVFCILHSRISELRRKGYVIEHRGGGAGTDVHEYRLVATPGQREPSIPSPGSRDAGTTSDGRTTAAVPSLWPGASTHHDDTATPSTVTSAGDDGNVEAPTVHANQLCLEVAA